MTVLGTDRFYFYEPDRQYIAEASALGLRPGQVMDGFILVGPTLSAVEMEHIRTLRDAEREVTAWVYRPADLPEEAEGFEVHVLND